MNKKIDSTKMTPIFLRLILEEVGSISVSFYYLMELLEVVIFDFDVFFLTVLIFV